MDGQQGVVHETLNSVSKLESKHVHLGACVWEGVPSTVNSSTGERSQDPLKGLGEE